MAWTIEVTDDAEKSLRKIGTVGAKRIADFLYGRVLALEHPRQIGQALQGSKLGELWRYRVGDFRILCKIQDKQLVVLVIEVGHRREIYR